MSATVCPRCRRYYPCICTRAARAGVAAVAAVALLTGCGGATGPEGTVTGKEHEPQRTMSRTEPKTKQQCTTTTRRTSTGPTTSRSCHTVPDGTRLVTDVHPECWELELDTGDEVCTDPDEWQRTRIGDEYPAR